MDDENFARDTAQSFFSQSQASGATGATSLATEQTVSILAIEKFKAQQQEPQHHHVHRICRICGRVVAAKGLPRFDTYSMSDPYCVVKAIKGNNHTMNVYITRTIMNNSAPVWDEEFDFQIRADQTTEEIVGLRLAVYEADGPGSSFHGSNDFLGGADLDLAGQKHARSVLHELELGGIITRKASSGRRPRLVLAVTIYREVVPRSLPRPLLLKQSLLKMSFVHQVFCTVVGAKELPNREMLGVSDPFCLVRAVLMSGKVTELYRTKVISNSLQPMWNEAFQAAFVEADQPLLLLFDVWDEDDPNKPMEAGGAQHLGSAAVPLLSGLEPAPRRRRLWLQGSSQRHETRLNHNGVARNAENGPKGGSKLSRQRSGHVLTSAKTFNVNKGTTPKTFFERLKDAVVEFKNQMTESADAGKRSVLSVELRTYTKTAKMPYVHLFQKPFFIHDADDLEKCLESPDWTRSSYTFPKQLESGQPERGLLSAEDHIGFVYGAIEGASFLPLSLGTPPDAYCMVHAVSTIGERQFIHRTRTIKQLTCPQWSEAFYSPLPEDFDTARLQISVYGATAANLVTKATSFIGGADPMLEGSNHEDDWFIGRAHVDLTTAVSGALIAEEVPIQGGMIPKQDRVTTGFRIQPGVAFEVMCERRLRPSFNEHSGEGVKMIPRRHHQLTRTSDPIQQSLPIIDNGQQSMLSVEDLELEKAAQETLELSKTGTLALRKGPKHDWSKLKTEEEEEDLLAEKPLEQILQESGDEVDSSFLDALQQPKALQEVRHVDFSQRELRREARSLPILKTKFHDSPELYKLNVIDKAAQARFSRRTEHRTSDITRSLREKPMFNRLHWHQPAELPVNLPPVAHG